MATLRTGWRELVDPAWLESWSPRPFALENGDTEIVVMGEGPPLLLLPGVPGFKEMWLGVASQLARRFRVVAFDLRAPIRGPVDWSMPLADLTRLADAWAPDRAIVVGHSMGGALAQRWALEHPDRVAGLVLSSSFAKVGSTKGNWRKRYVEQLAVLLSQRWLPESVASRLAVRFAARGAWVYDRNCDARTLAFLRHTIRTVSPSLVGACVRLALRHDLRDDLAGLRVPTLLVVGEQETPWARRATEELARLIPEARTRVSPGVAHLHPLTAPAWLADAVTEWAESLDRIGGAGVSSREARTSGSPRP